MGKVELHRKYLQDLSERVISTALQAGISVAIVEINDWGYEWSPIIVVTLTVIKGILARSVGESESASINPKG